MQIVLFYGGSFIFCMEFTEFIVIVNFFNNTIFKQHSNTSEHSSLKIIKRRHILKCIKIWVASNTTLNSGADYTNFVLSSTFF